jgi:hypothetical protein
VGHAGSSLRVQRGRSEALKCRSRRGLAGLRRQSWISGSLPAQAQADRPLGDLAMYAPNDPRAALASAQAAAPMPSRFAAADIGLFYAQAPQESGDDSKTWLLRGQNFVVAYSEAQPGACFHRHGQVDEYVVLVQRRANPVTVEAGGMTASVTGHSLIIVPPGDSMVSLPGRRKHHPHLQRAIRRSRGAGVERRILCRAAEQHPRLRALARSARRLPDQDVQPGRAARAGPLRPDLALPDSHGQRPRRADRPARRYPALAASSRRF